MGYAADQINKYFCSPQLLGNTTPREKYNDFVKHNVEVKPLGSGKLKGVDFNDGGGFKVGNGKDGMLFMYHPAQGSHHNGEYYKLSSGSYGILRYNMNGELIK